MKKVKASLAVSCAKPMKGFWHAPSENWGLMQVEKSSIFWKLLISFCFAHLIIFKRPTFMSKRKSIQYSHPKLGKKKVSRRPAVLEKLQVYANICHPWETVTGGSSTLYASPTRFARDNTEEHDFRVWNYRSRCKLQERLCKRKRRTSAKERLLSPAKPNHCNGDCFDAINVLFMSVCITGKKIASFENRYSTRDCGCTSSMMCDVGTLTILVSSAICPACHERRFSTRSGAS